jgi:hypothetical protein
MIREFSLMLWHFPWIGMNEALEILVEELSSPGNQKT